jgi:hypothetical protein
MNQIFKYWPFAYRAVKSWIIARVLKFKFFESSGLFCNTLRFTSCSNTSMANTVKLETKFTYLFTKYKKYLEYIKYKQARTKYQISLCVLQSSFHQLGLKRISEPGNVCSKYKKET